jgi:hypothetical protein
LCVRDETQWPEASAVSTITGGLAPGGIGASMSSLR